MRHQLPRLLTVVLIVLSLFLCAKQREQDKRDNPLDVGGGNFYPPAVTAMGGVTIFINDTIALKVTGNDENGNVVLYFWALDGWNYKDSTTACSIKTVFPDSGIHKIRVKSQDSDGLFSNPDSMVAFVRLCRPVVLGMNDATIGINDSGYLLDCCDYYGLCVKCRGPRMPFLMLA
jgi:hypothetical protein